MDENWIQQQTEINVQQWDCAMEEHYPESRIWLRDPKKYYIRLCEECNYLDSVKQININEILPPN